MGGAGGRIGANPVAGGRTHIGGGPAPRTNTFTQSFRVADPRRADTEDADKEAKEKARQALREKQAIERRERMELVQKKDAAKRAAKKRKAEFVRACAVRIQMRWRGLSDRRHFSILRANQLFESRRMEEIKCALTIQAMLRGRNGRNEYLTRLTTRVAHKRENAAIIIQYASRRRARQRRLLQALLSQNNDYFVRMRTELQASSASTIQQFHRRRKGAEQPKLFQLVKSDQVQAAMKLQRTFRERTARSQSTVKLVPQPPTTRNTRGGGRHAGSGDARLKGRQNVKQRRGSVANSSRTGGGYTQHGPDHGKGYTSTSIVALS